MKPAADTRHLFRQTVATTWIARCQAEGWKRGSKTREAHALSYAQGVLAAASILGHMSIEECNGVSFLALCGRIEQWLEDAL